MRRIGLVDYFLDEYHAHEAFKSLKRYNEEHNSDWQIYSAYGEIDHIGGLTTAEFCAQHGIKVASTIAELVAEVDGIMILAPDNSEKKEEYAMAVMSCANKPVFMDKTFTDSYASAVRIFDKANETKTPLCSSSSLRFATELVEFNDCKSVLVFGSGVDMVDYAVHYLEIAISCMGIGINSARWEARGEQEWAHLTYGDGRQATLVISMGEYLDFHVFLADKNGTTRNLPIASPIFYNQMQDTVRFFETGAASFDKAETLELMKARDAILESKAKGGAVVNI